jgi:hypothetical protein
VGFLPTLAARKKAQRDGSIPDGRANAFDDLEMSRREVADGAKTSRFVRRWRSTNRHPSDRVEIVANETLVHTIKALVALAKDGDLDGVYRGYRDLFTAAPFLGYRVEDQRQALRLMVMMKGAPEPPTQPMIEAHRAAIQPLKRIVEVHREPKDHELLGICHVVVGDEGAAMSIFKAGLAIERQKSPGSDLCGQLMKRVSML